MWDRGPIDLLHAYPGTRSRKPQSWSNMLPRLVASFVQHLFKSRRPMVRQVHCTIAVVRYRSHNRERGGIASTTAGRIVRTLGARSADLHSAQ